MRTWMKTAVAAVAALVAVQTASAALIVNTLGDRGDGMIVVQISYDGIGDNTGTWQVPANILNNSVEVLVVGGGGAGARGSSAFNGNGGGAGGLYYTTSWSVTPGSWVNVAVGAGAPTTTSTGTAASGGNSVFGSIIAYGGQGGITGVQGGNQGGYSIDGGSNITPGFLGGTGEAAAGGAGATQNGRNSGFSPAYGGAGAVVPITGGFGVIDANGNTMISHVLGAQGGYDIIGYAGGGSAGYDGVALGTQYGESYGGGSGSEPEGQPGTPGLNLTGGGGGGGRSANGGGGGSGVIYIAYAIPEPATFGMLGAAAMAMLLRRRFAK
jgi:hypothetical protein